jgi:glycolate oxidase iron-sulfur subunit
VKLVELKESDWCCGSAGVYNITHADRAAKVLARKIQHVKATGADVVAASNPGCLLQLQAGVREAGLRARVVHPVVLLDEAYRAEAQGAGSHTVEGG